MAGKKQTTAPVPTGKIYHQTLEDVMHSSMMPYAEYVIMERALPRVEDGLKPVQRRILYTMMELALWPDKPHRKSARVVGDCLGKYHPHGDTSVYDAMVRMAQDFNMSVPLVDGHGNFGSVDGDSAAAMRYTEVRLTPAALEMLRDIEKDTVPFSLNFDDTLKEPDMLPCRFPNLLVNGTSGIAVGLATNIPPHNLAEAIDGAIALMKDPNITLDEMMEIVKGPDFPTGGYCTGGEELRKAYETGRGRLLVRAKTHIERDKNGKSRIVITELPFQVNKAAMLEKILKLAEEKKGILTGISDIRDESDRTGTRAIVELRKDADAESILQYLFKYSDLQVTFGVNMVAIADGHPQQMGLLDVLHHYVEYQKHVVTMRTQYDLEEAEKREHILEGLMIAVDNIDQVIRIIRASKDTKEARDNLMSTFDLTSVQAQAILDMRLRRLTALEMTSLREEYAQVQALIAELRSILESDKKLRSVIIKEMQEIKKKYPVQRRTAMADLEQVDVSALEQTKESEPVDIVLTQNGYIKRISQKNAARVKDTTGGEDTKKLLSCLSDEKIRLFTDKGNVFAVAAEDIPECKLKDRGTAVAGILQGLEQGETVVSMLHLKEDSPDLLFVTAQGMAKRAAVEEYFAKRSKMAACGLKDEDRVLSVQFAQDDKTVLMVSRSGNAIRFACDTVPAQGRSAGGVKCMALGEQDMVLFASVITGEETLALFTDRGYAKRMPAGDVEIQNRNGKGQRVFPLAGDNANGLMLADVHMAGLQDEFLILQKKGAKSPVRAAEIPVQTKQGKGVPFVLALFDDLVTKVQTVFRRD